MICKINGLRFTLVQYNLRNWCEHRNSSGVILNWTRCNACFAREEKNLIGYSNVIVMRFLYFYIFFQCGTFKKTKQKVT